ncbi:MAG TPA: hypothetical protein VMJ73_15615 [Rhizomicrobium sp.]|nr:hypothetical protein [Rhizomicrobium sp.]
MQPKKSFGRRPQPEQPRLRLVHTESVPVAPEPAPVAEETSPDVDRELEEWKAARKRYKRSFREPWRTLSIVCGLGFAVSTWLLPDSVADVAELVTGGLSAASLFAGIRTEHRPAAEPNDGVAQT